MDLPQRRDKPVTADQAVPGVRAAPSAADEWPCRTARFLALCIARGLRYGFASSMG